MSLARLHAAFAKRKALVTYVMGGDASVDDAVACARAGADVLELGFPFSDPIADGPVIQAAATRALKNGATLSSVLTQAKELRQRTDVPIALMGYLNPVLSFGVERFVATCAEVGVDAIILPDLPPEEADVLTAACAKHDVGTVFFLAPTSTPAREAAVLRATTGFVYFVSVTGVTGSRTGVPDISEHVTRVKAKARVPVVVGFGVSSPESAAKLSASCDGVVVGSALVERLARGESPASFISSLRTAF